LKKSYIGLALFAGMMGAGVLAFYPGLTGPYYADDFKFLFSEPSEKFFYFFLHPNPNGAFYRPLDSMVLAVIQSWAGSNTLPIHILALTLHAALSWLVMSWVAELTGSRLAGILSGVYMLLSQANAMAVLGNDTLSQIGGALAGYGALWYFYRFNRERNDSPGASRSLLLSLILFACSLWFKETGVGFLLAIVAIAVTMGGISARQVYPLAPYLLITLGYVIVRSIVLTGQSAERYDFSFGANFPVNLGMFYVSAFMPSSSVTAYLWLVEGSWLLIATIILLTLTLSGSIIWGVLRSPDSRLFWPVAAIAAVSVLPLTFMKHVSELYVYNMMPAISLLLGAGITEIVRRCRTQPARVTVIISLAALFWSHAYADWTKSGMSTANGLKAWWLLEKVVPFAERVPRNGTLVLLNPPSTRPQYSIFLMEGFNPLNYSAHVIRQYSGREDIQVWIEDADRPRSPFPPQSLFVTLEGDQVVMSSRQP